MAKFVFKKKYTFGVQLWSWSLRAKWYSGLEEEGVWMKTYFISF